MLPIVLDPYTLMPILVLIVALQFYEYGGGSVFEVAAALNGVSYDPATPIATPITHSTDSTSTNGAVRPSAAMSSAALSLLFALVFGALVGGSLSPF